MTSHPVKTGGKVYIKWAVIWLERKTVIKEISKGEQYWSIGQHFLEQQGRVSNSQELYSDRAEVMGLCQTSSMGVVE